MLNKKGYAAIFILCLILSNSHYYAKGAEGDDFTYNAKGKRDPFVPLIGRAIPIIVTLKEVLSPNELTLEGIAIGAGGKQIAILNGQMVRENDRFGALLIKKISQKRVEFSIEGKDYKMNIREPEEKIDSGK